MISEPDRRSRSDDRRLDGVWLLFVVPWAIAVLFHLAGNPRLAPAWGRGLLGGAAILALARPRDPRAAVPLALAVLVNVWLEAPVLGNHFLLHGFVAVLVIAGAVTAGGRGGAAMARIGGPLRCTLLAFYVFAAFAKLNRDFFDPAVSCAVFYLEESVGSWGLGGLVEGWPSWAERGLAVVVAGIELSIPVLLVVRRSRNVGVVVALVFHYVLALDRTHQFFDFSSVLAALFLLFLAPETADRLVGLGERLRSGLARRWDSGPELTRLVALAGAALVVAVAAGPANWPAPVLLRDVGLFFWLVGGAALIVAVAVSLRGRSTRLERITDSNTSPLLYALPLVAVLNGLTPYAEVKSGTGWNMYSNLAVIDGQSNHLLVRRGVPLTDGYDRLVEIVDAGGSSDLGFYVGSDWLLPERMLLDHLGDRPGVVVRGEVDGERVTYEGGERPGRPRWQQKFQVFRAVDADGPVSCQPSFGPAR